MKMHLNLQLKIVRWSLAPLALWLCCGRVAAQTPVVDRNSIAGTTVLHTSHSISPRLRLEASYARLPLVFEPNQGQCDSRAKYLARGNGYTLFLTLRGAVLSLSKQSANNAGTHPHSKRGTEFQDNRRAAMLGMKIVGGNPNPHVVGSDTQLGTTNYFLG